MEIKMVNCLNKLLILAFMTNSERHLREKYTARLGAIGG
jgi:hypothetical protein